MRILVVEDDEKVALFVVRGLQGEGYTVDHVGDGESGLCLMQVGDYDAAVIDLMLPERDGLSLIQELRRSGKQTPVIILSAKRTVDERVQGLQAGGDDYLVKPFAFSELAARVQALLRRASGQTELTVLRYGDLVLDVVQREVRREDDRIILQPREFALLEYLLRNAGRVVSRTMILEHVWGYHFDPHANVVDAQICRLRDKVDKPYLKKLIHTVRGAGYVLREKG